MKSESERLEACEEGGVERGGGHLSYPFEDSKSLDFSSSRNEPSRRLRHECKTDHDENGGCYTDADHRPPLARIRFEQIGAHKACRITGYE